MRIKVFDLTVILFILLALPKVLCADTEGEIAIANPGFNNSGNKWLYDWGCGANTVEFITTDIKVNVARIIYSGANWVYLWPETQQNEKMTFSPSSRYAVSFLAKWEDGDSRLEIGFRRVNCVDKKLYDQERTQDTIIWQGSVPKDGKWHNITVILKTPKFDNTKYYLVPVIGISSELTKMPTTVDIDDIKILQAKPDMKDTIEDYQPPEIRQSQQIKIIRQRISTSQKQINQLEEAIAVAQQNKQDVSKAKASLAIMKYFPIRPDYFDAFLQPAELTPENLEQISAKLDYIENSSKKWINYLSSCSAMHSIRPVPEPDISHLKIKDGYFEVDGTPVFLMGPEGDRLHILEDLDFIKALGANAVGVEVTPLDIETKGFDARLKHFLAEAQKRNITVRIMLSGHFFPMEVSSLPQAKRILYYPMYQGFFMVASSQKVCIESQPVRVVLENFIQKIIAVTKNSPAVSSYIIWNEPYYMCYCSQSIMGFRIYLAMKYKNISALNDAWKSDYKDFSQCLPPRILRKNWNYSLNPDNRVALHDWLLYNNDRMFRFFKWIKDNIRKNGDMRLTHIKKASWQFAAYGSMGGIDSERLSERLEETPGFDTAYTYDSQGNFSLAPLMSVDFADSISYGKPISHDELHMVIPPKHNGNRPPRDAKIMRSCIFEDFVHGVDQQYFFIWRKGSYYHSLLDPKTTPAETLEAYADAIIDIQRLTPQILQLQKATKNVAIFYGQTNFLYTPPELLGGGMFKTLQLRDMENCYKALFPLSHPIRFITEHQINRNNFENVKVILVPTTQYIPNKTCQAMLEYVNKGGIIIIGANSFIGDENMRPNQFLAHVGIHIKKRILPKFKTNTEKVSEIDELLAHTTMIEQLNSVQTKIVPEKTDIFSDRQWILIAVGIREEVSGGTVLAKYPDGSTAMVIKKLGKGKIYYLGTSLEQEAMSEFLELLFGCMPTKFSRPVIVKNLKGQIPFGVELRSVIGGDSLLVYIFNSTKKAVTLKLQGVSKTGTDILTMKKYTDNIRLDPITPVLLKYSIKP